jgi:hypothetical protein
MRTASRLILIVSAVMVGFLVGRLSNLAQLLIEGDGSGSGWTTHTGLSIEQIQPLSSLVTARVEVADVVETTLGGYTGSAKVAILVKGDFLLGTDLSAARFEAVDTAHHTATLVLPQPSATSPRVDHARTRVFAINTAGLWQVVPGGDEGRAVVINRAYADAQRIIAVAANNPELIDRSRRQSEAVMRGFFQIIGWTVEIRWRLSNDP